MAKELYESGSHFITYNYEDRMIYHNAVINPGQHYSTSTGEYTCPVTGFYFFSYSVSGYSIAGTRLGDVACASLFREGARISKISAANFDSEEVDVNLSHSDIIECNEGDRVWVQSCCYNNHIYGEDVFSVFSGALLNIA